MKVQEVKLEGNKRRYLLIDDNGMPILPVAKYMKSLDKNERSPNTQKTYCEGLKLYFLFLKEVLADYRCPSFSLLQGFVAWLRNPYENNKVVSVKPVQSKRKISTINLYITAVTNFYDYLYKTEEIDNDIVDKVMKQVIKGGGEYKSFLHHVNKDKATTKNILKLRVPKKRIRPLEKNAIQKLVDATTNIRDEFLIRLLYETGLRIGEALSLFIEDIICDHKKGHKIKLVYRGELENGACLKTGERELNMSQSLLDLFDDYEYEILDELEIDTNFLFVKIRGKNKGKPLEYAEVSDLFKRLKKKTGINAHAHLLRHSNATTLYRETKDIKHVQEALGHSQIQTTMNMYVHPSDDDIRKNWEIAQPAFKFERKH